MTTLKHLEKNTGLHPHCLRCGSSASRLLELQIRIPPRTWTSASFECFVLSDRSLYIVQGSPTECGVSECDREASLMRRPWPTRDCWATKKNKPIIVDSSLCTFTSTDPKYKALLQRCTSFQYLTWDKIQLYFILNRAFLSTLSCLMYFLSLLNTRIALASAAVCDLVKWQLKMTNSGIFSGEEGR